MGHGNIPTYSALADALAAGAPSGARLAASIRSSAAADGDMDFGEKAAAATLSGTRGYQEIGEWVQKQSDAVLKYFKVGKRRGKLQRPSVYCIRNVLVQIDPELFDAALRNWCISIDGTDTAIAIDGKTLRSAIDENGRQLHVLGASGHRTRRAFR